MQTFAEWVSLPESRSAHKAIRRVARTVQQRRVQRALNPLFLHGPAGTGKTYLLNALVAHAAHHTPDLMIAILAARELRSSPVADEPSPDVGSDVVIIEDLQHLHPAAIERFVQLVDSCRSRGRQLLISASVGPAELNHLPRRLSTRLSAGLVVRLHPLSPASRLAFLTDRAQRQGRKFDPALLAWLAQHLPGSGRQLEGALGRLETLTALSDRPLSPDVLAEHFRDAVDARNLTVESIAQRVGRYFRVGPDRLQARSRERQTLVPRQVVMYLARRLTPLSLRQIGVYFGGRDHSTVLHACRKVEKALTHDAVLCGAVQQLQADLQ